ncbi:MAG: hypothetical protein ACOCYO_03945 [Bacteroidota bacterium]
MPTDKEIKDLKIDWMKDPIWDIEETEGFEDHKEELKAFREEKEAQWDAKAKMELQNYAFKIGIPDQLILAKHMQYLERRINELSDENSSLYERISDLENK